MAIVTASDIAVLQRAYARVQAGDGAGGTAILNQLPVSARGHPDALMVAALAARASGDNAAARPLFEAASRAAPGHPGIWNGYANLLDALGEADLAIAAYQRALAIDPKSVATWANLADTAIAAARWDTADAALGQALALDPHDSRALAARGRVEMGRGRPDLAIKAYRIALQIAPNDALTRHNLAVALRSQGGSDAALAVLGPPQRPESAVLRGHLLIDQGQFDAAIEQFQAILAQNPADLPALEALATLLPQLDRRAEALTGYRNALDGAPVALWQAAITAAKGLGEPATIIEWAQQAAKLHGRHPDWLLAEAGARSQLGDSGTAMALATAAARDFAPSGATETTLAWLFLKAGAPQKAEQHALAATRLAPLDQSPWALLTLIWRLTDDPREAWLVDYDRFVIADEIETPPGWANLAQFLADLAETLGARHQMLRAPADQSLRGGTQTRGSLFATADPVLLALQNALVATVEVGLAGLKPDASHPFLGRLTGKIAMAGSWSVRLAAQGFHISHIHHSGWLSSAFYVAVPPEIGAADSDAGKLLFGVPDAALGLHLAPRRVVTPVPGRLAIFPSYIWHGTAPFESAAARLTVAFDALPKA